MVGRFGAEPVDQEIIDRSKRVVPRLALDQRNRPDGAGSETLSMHSATNGQDPQSLLSVWLGQQGMSSDIAGVSLDIAGVSLDVAGVSLDIACMSSSAAPGTGMANAGDASGASRSPAATSSMTRALANRFRYMINCRMAGWNLQFGSASRFCQGRFLARCDDGIVP